MSNDSQGTMLDQALAHHRKGQLAQAEALYERLLADQPDHFDALQLLGYLAYQTNRHIMAVELISKAIQIKPSIAGPYSNLGLALHALGQLDKALASYDQAIALKPDFAEAHYNRGHTLKELQQPDAALDSYDAAIARNPGFAAGHNARGNVLTHLRRFLEALASYDKAIALNANFADAHNNRGNTLNELMRLEEALLSYDKAIALKPDNAGAYNNRGNTLQKLKRLDGALLSYDKAIALKPDYADAYNNRGNTLKELKRLDEALVSYEKAIALKPNYADAFNNRGNALMELKRPDEALLSFDKAIACKTEYAEAHNNRGSALKSLKRLNEALISYDRAVALRPDYADAYNNFGTALTELKRTDQALACYDKAIALKPDYAEAHNHRANTLHDLKRFDEAAVSYEKALALNADYEFVPGSLLHTKTMLCDWRNFDAILRKCEADIRSAKKAAPPFPLLALLDSPDIHKQATRIYVDALYPRMDALGTIKKNPKSGKIRVGYYSADFYNHATASLVAGLFEAHDAEKFELFGFSFGPNKQDEMSKRVSSAFEHFLAVGDKSDREIARQSRELGIDIAVDLKGLTADSRMGIFAERCAPVQVSYLGYPGTTGAEYIDYIIADTIVIPKDRQSDFTEKVAYLPHSYQVNDSTRRISERVFTRQELELPESGFVFCCFNNSYKILPSTFDAWMRILKAVEGSVLWLLEDNPAAAKNLRQEAESRAVEGHRLIFAKRMPLDEHLARHRFADLFLDTLPCNAHTTASDALWAGLPVLTCVGQSFASRVAASVLNAIELPELIASTEVEYEARAIELATDPGKLSAIKLKLDRNRLTAPLFDVKLFAKHIESAYEAMYERYHAGLTPEGFEVKA